MLCITNYASAPLEQTCQPNNTVLNELRNNSIELVDYDGPRDFTDIVYLINDNFDLLIPMEKKDPFHYYAAFNQDIMPRLRHNVIPVSYPDMQPIYVDLFIRVLRDAINNRVIGFISYYFNEFDKSLAQIDLMAVKKEYRGKGYGKLLLHDAFKHISSQGIHDVHINVVRTNKTAYYLYKQCGFTKIRPITSHKQHLAIPLMGTIK